MRSYIHFSYFSMIFRSSSHIFCKISSLIESSYIACNECSLVCASEDPLACSVGASSISNCYTMVENELLKSHNNSDLLSTKKGTTCDRHHAGDHASRNGMLRGSVIKKVTSPEG